MVIVSVLRAKVVLGKTREGKDILVPTASPVISGDGSIDVLCGTCGTILIKHARPNLAIQNMLIRCPHCHRCNDTLDMNTGHVVS
jgi:hypothetical protein